MNRRGGRGRHCLPAVLGITAALTFGVAACGEDDEETPSSPQPVPAAPVGETPPAGVEPEPAPAPAPEPAPEPEPQPTEPGGSGGVSPPEPEPAPGGGGGSGGVGPGQVPPDSPDNDVAPEPGSPAEQFEQYCNLNPEACR